METTAGRQIINTHHVTSTPAAAAADWRRRAPDATLVHALLFGGCFHDPHMMCSKLGKRHYCKESSSAVTSKRGNYSAPATRCQVEGCHVTLAIGDAKEYYRKHKVCEFHSKAPKVVVSGVVQRFCQQCSRFHGVTEFDEAKRSCRRRLKGHNQRRRKGSMKLGGNPGVGGCATAYSLLSYPPDTKPPAAAGGGDFPFPSTCSAALYELIVANRPTSGCSHIWNHHHESAVSHEDRRQTFPMWDRETAARSSVDVKAITLAFEFGAKEKPEEEEDSTHSDYYCWSSFGGANVN